MKAFFFNRIYETAYLWAIIMIGHMVAQFADGTFTGGTLYVFCFMLMDKLALFTE